MSQPATTSADRPPRGEAPAATQPVRARRDLLAGGPVPLDYLLRRSGQLLLMVAIAVTVNFLVPRLLSGGPGLTAVHRARLGLNQPLWQQYLDYWGRLLRLDLGISSSNYPATVMSTIQGALPWTLGLLGASTVIAFVLGTLLGAVLAWPRAPRLLRLLAPALLLPSTVPAFLLALLLLLLLVTEWRIFPPGGAFDPLTIPRFDLATALDILVHALLPAITMVLSGLGFWAIGMRGTMVSVLGEDYITFADAKGLPARRIFLAYGLRNALLPQVTSLGVALGSAMSGALLVEVMFSYPGLGWMLYQAIIGRDYFLIQGIVLVVIVVLALALFIVDLLYPLLDPRVRYRRD